MVLAFAQRLGAAVLADRFPQEFAKEARARYEERRAVYRTWEAWYDGTLLTEAPSAAGDDYRYRSGLSRTARIVVNPVKPAVDFYAWATWPGGWSLDGGPAPDGSPNAVRFADGTDPDLMAAVMQGLAWSNWQFDRYVAARTLAKLGQCFARVAHDAERRVVHADLIHPAEVDEVGRNGAGDVVFLSLDYPVTTEDGDRYQYRLEIDRDAFRTFRDGAPTGFDGNRAVMPNPYGFVPVVDCLFANDGHDRGDPVFAGVLPTIKELNNVVSGLGDYAVKIPNQPFVLTTTGSIAGITASGKAVAESSRDYAHEAREEVVIWKAPTGTQVFPLMAGVDVAGLIEHKRDLEAHVNDRLPEARIMETLKQLTSGSGRAIERLLAPIQGRAGEVQSGANSFLTKLGQMLVSCGAYHWRRGELRTTADGQKFAAYDPERSYRDGDLDFALVNAPLIAPTMAELAESAAAFERVKTPTGLSMLGLSDTDIYGAGNEPAEPVGVLAEREEQALRAVERQQSVFDRGGGI